jgi:alginate O-acetyltransferase complex protein AlgI
VFAHWINSAAGTSFSVTTIFLPIGLSFYTFQKISYLVDVYRDEIKPVVRFLDFCFFALFFPQVVAGPILRAKEFIPQMYQPYSLSQSEFGLSVFWILKGLFKKMALSDYMSLNFIDRVFAHPNLYTGFENIVACYAYSLQVYFDFSGYTDIAIGLSLLLGFRLPQNFNEPHKAESVAEFWKRWHISLSNWLRDYLYIPLGGNKHGEFRTSFNLLATMLLGGLWHGASWNFVIWGGLNGLALLLYRYWRRISPIKDNHALWATLLSVFLTFSFISFTRIFFRSQSLDAAFEMIGKIFGGFNPLIVPSILEGYLIVFLVILLGFFFQWMPDLWKTTVKNYFIESPLYAQAAIAVAIVFVIYQSLSSELQPFIYFQF